MVSLQTILNKLQPYKGKQTIVTDNQTTNDIVSGLLSTHKQYATEYDKIYKYFLGDNVKETCKNIFNFLKLNVPYEIESGANQTLRSPAAILEHLQGADCKSYALFTNGVLDAIRRNENKNFDLFFRFAGYGLKNNLEHVFSVVQTNKNEYWNDCVLSYFDSREKTPNFIFDKKIKPMALVKVSGIPQQIQQHFNYQQRTILEQLKPQPTYVYYGKQNPNTAIGSIDDIVNALPLPTIATGLIKNILNLFGGKSDGEKRKDEFDKAGISVDDIAKYYIKNRNNFGQFNDWQLNEFSELYSNKAPQQGHNWKNRNSEIKLDTAKAFNTIVSQYLTRYDAANWQPLLIPLNEVNQQPNPQPSDPQNPQTPSEKSKLLPLGLGILAIKLLM